MGNAYQPHFDEDIKLRFSFLYGDEASYSGMANLYRSTFSAKNRRVNPEKEIPFVLELIGAVHLVRPVLGVPRTITTALPHLTKPRRLWNGSPLREWDGLL